MTASARFKPTEAVTMSHKIGIAIVGIAVLVGGAVLGGWIPELAPVEIWIWFALTAGAGAIGGVLFTIGKGPLHVGLVSGPIASLGSLGLVSLLLRTSTSVNKLVLVITVFVGLVPGGLVQWLLLRRAQP
jgi:hypothetical protein